jgi:hypothetical protein
VVAGATTGEPKQAADQIAAKRSGGNAADRVEGERDPRYIVVATSDTPL